MSDERDSTTRSIFISAAVALLVFVIAVVVSSESTKTGQCTGVCAAYGQKYISRSDGDKGDTLYCMCDASMHTWQAFVKEKKKEAGE